MKNKIACCLTFIIICSCTPSQDKPKVGINELKFAVAYCLSKSYPDSACSEDSSYVSGAYLHKGHHGIDMYEKIRQFVESYRKEAYVSKHGRNLSIMQCIDLYDSDNLMKLIHNNAD